MSERGVHMPGLWARIWQYRHFYLFISPFFILFAIFGAYPLVHSLYLSTVKWDGLTSPAFIGLENFRALLQDTQFYTSLWNTLVIGVLHIPPMFILAFLFAVLLSQNWLKMRAIWRAAVFIPCVTPMVVIAFVFSILFDYENGLVNYLLSGTFHGVGAFFGLLGLRGAGWVEWLRAFEGVGWVQTEAWSKITVSLLLVWRWTGYNMVIMLAGLQGIDRSIYEAATIDGASGWQQMKYLTIPLMRPIFVFVSIMSLIGTAFMFDEVFVLTDGGPGDSSTTFGLFLYQRAFTDFRFGYASAAAYTVAFLVFILTILILKRSKPSTG